MDGINSMIFFVHQLPLGFSPTNKLHRGLECTELPPYADALRDETKLPVFDAITNADAWARVQGMNKLREMWLKFS